MAAFLPLSKKGLVAGGLSLAVRHSSGIETSDIAARGLDIAIQLAEVAV